MGKREYVFEDRDVIKYYSATVDPNLKLIIPTNVEIENYSIVRVGGLQVYGYEFDVNCTKYGGITLPQGKLTKNFWFEFIKEYESIKLFLGDYQDVKDWF